MKNPVVNKAFIAFFLLFSLQTLADTPKIFHYSMNSAPKTLDPVRVNDVYGSLVGKNIFHTLLEYKYLKRPFELKPNLAEAMPTISKDQLTYTFKIKKGVHYADDACFANGKGREVVVQDLIYEFMRLFDPATKTRNAWMWIGKIKGMAEWKKKKDYTKAIPGIKAIDNHTIQFTLKEKYPEFLYTLAMTPAAFVPKECVKKYGDEFSVRPVGSGPFMLKSFDSTKAVMVANPNFKKLTLNLKDEGYDEAKHGNIKLKYLDGQKYPFIDGVTVHFIHEATSRWQSFLRGEIHNTGVPTELIDKVLETKTPTIKFKKEYSVPYFARTKKEFGMVFVNFNMANPELGYNKDPKRNRANKKIRCGLRKAFSWPERIRRFYYGLGQAYPGIIPEGALGYESNPSPKMKESITYDPEGSKKLLAEAMKIMNWTAKDLPTIKYAYVAGAKSRQFYEQTRGFYTRVGYPKEKIKEQPFPTFGDFSRAMREKKLDYMGYGWQVDWPDAKNTLGLYYGPNESPGVNSANFKNAEYDDLFRQVSVMSNDAPGLLKKYKRMNEILVEECAMIGSYSRTGIGLTSRSVRGLPDRNVLGGYFVKYVDIKKDESVKKDKK